MVPTSLQLPAASTARADTVYEPGARVAGINALSDDDEMLSGVAFPRPGSAPIHHSPPIRPDSPSADVAVSVVAWSTVGVAGSSVRTGTVGAVRSTLIVRFRVVVSPTRSVAVPVIGTATPSCVPVEVGAGQPATPEAESVQSNVAVTVALCHPAALAAGNRFTSTAGGVVSTRTVTNALLPSEPIASMTWAPSARPVGVNGPR